MMTNQSTVRLSEISKRFGTLRALDRVDFEFRAGEIRGLLGENGAGKSTLMKILFGILRPDSGRVSIDEKTLDLRSPHDAIDAGIGMVHQHFHLVESFTVAENVVLGESRAERTRRRPALRELAGRLKLADWLDVRVERLSVGVRQRVEILKALHRNARILLLDEPTSVLTPGETDELFDMLRELRAQGTAIVFITHKLGEVIDVTDRVTVMRGGKVVGTLPTAEATQGVLAEMMVGRAMNPPPARTKSPDEEKRLELRNVSARGTGTVSLRNVSLAVRAGEIFGVAGVDGNGQVELAEAVAGLLPFGGAILLDGKPAKGGRRGHAALGIGYVPLDRRAEGLALDLSLAENAVLGCEDRPEYRRNFLLSPRKLTANASRLIADFDIRAQGPSVSVASLSGGNQQKLLIARELAHEPRLLVAVNPTWGVDVGAVEYIHRKLCELRDRGGSVLLISNELDEIQALSDRFAVLHAGELSEPLPPDTPRERIGLLMAGAEE